MNHVEGYSYTLEFEDVSRVDLGVTWDFEIQLTWNFFNALSNLVGIYFLNSFCDSLFDLPYA